MKREKYIGPFSRSQLPTWRCPSCADGIVKLNKATLNEQETISSQNAQKHEDWEPDWMEENFSAVLVCNHCKENIFVIGHTEVVQAMDEEHGWRLERQLKPNFFRPTIQIIEIPKQCPEDVRNVILSAFSVYWSNLPSCANRIRTALEIILNKLKIKRTEKSSKGKLRRLTLGNRITIYAQGNKDVGDVMSAVKWLGNAGSHEDRLRDVDLLDAFEMLDHILGEVYAKKSNRFKKLVSTVNKNQGPVQSPKPTPIHTDLN